MGLGWVRIPLDWLVFRKNEFTGWVVRLGKLRLRILKIRNWEAYVVQENWRWPFWWLALRIWLTLLWFEKNLRLTAAIWGILWTPEPGAMPLWGDFALLHLLRRRRMHGPAC